MAQPKIRAGYPGQPELGRSLREFRQARGMSAALLAYRIGQTTVAHLNRIENGRYSCGPVVRAKIAAVFGVDETDIWPAALLAEADQQRAKSRHDVALVGLRAASAARRGAVPRSKSPRSWKPREPKPREPKPPKPPREPKPPKPPRYCKCGCAMEVKGSQRYAPGHYKAHYEAETAAIRARRAAREREENQGPLAVAAQTGRLASVAKPPRSGRPAPPAPVAARESGGPRSAQRPAPALLAGRCACGCEFETGPTSRDGFRPGHKENPPRITRSGRTRWPKEESK